MNIIEEISTLYDFLSKYRPYWEIIQEAADENEIDLDQWTFDGSIEEVDALVVTFVDTETDETLIISINTSDSTYEIEREDT